MFHQEKNDTGSTTGHGTHGKRTTGSDVTDKQNKPVKKVLTFVSVFISLVFALLNETSIFLFFFFCCVDLGTLQNKSLNTIDKHLIW